MFPRVFLKCIFLVHAVTSTEQATDCFHIFTIEPHSEILIFKVELEPSAITRTCSRLVSLSYSKLTDKIIRKSNRLSTRSYMANPPNYRSWARPPPCEATENAHQSVKPSMSPHHRVERRAHYHHRRGQQHLKYHKPHEKTTLSENAHNSNPNTTLRTSFGCLNRIVGKTIINTEAPSTHILWNKFINFIIKNSTICGKNSIVEKKQISISRNTPQRSKHSDSSSTSTQIIESNSPIDNTNPSSIHTIDITTPSSKDTLDNTTPSPIHPIDNTTPSSIHTNTTLKPILTTTAHNKLVNFILHPHIVHVHKHYPQYEVKKKYYMPVLVVADKSFLDFHRNADYDTYILTVMNMASELLHDLTLGVSVELTLARTIYLEEDSKQFEVDCDITSCLQNFCRWTQKINPRDATHPSHHDVAILVTRYSSKESSKFGKWCGKLGASQLGDACVAGKSCVVVRDTGLALGINIAQQLGFLLGAPPDDGLEDHCPPETSENTTVFKHVMAPTPRHGAMVWSPCSRNAVVSFFSQGLGACLEDEPPKTMLAFLGILPGVMYDANYQCHLMKPGSKACYFGSAEFCRQLYCQRGAKKCVFKGRGPAQGTPCGSDKWCFNGECVHSGERPGSVSGGWGPWLSWEVCSRTCGGGVRRSRRNCDSPVPTAGGRYCAGDAIRHHTCNTHPCNSTERSFRAVQCSAFDVVVISGEQHRWSPMAPLAQDTCGLYCTSENGLRVRLRPRAIDGTECRSITNDVCIDGVCTRVGCDWKIGSKTINDRCGVCGGDGSHCNLVQAWYNTTSDNNLGSKLVAVIPTGSRKIKIYEACSSVNNLALSNVPALNEKEEFFFIGNGAEGEFTIISTVGIYSHNIQSGADMILIEDPLPVTIKVYVILKGVLAPIHYSYMDMHIVGHTESEVTEAMNRPQRNPFMERNNPLHWNRYQWEHLEWSWCSARCEVGTSLCIPHCVSVWFGRVSDSYCDPAKKPQPRVRVCNEQPCAVRWRAGPWSASTCDISMQWRAVQCVREARSYLSAHTVVDPRCCDADPPPPSVRPCSSVSNQQVFELNKINPNIPLTTQYYIAVLDPAKRTPPEEFTDTPYIIKKGRNVKTLNQRNDKKSLHETTIAPRTKEMQQTTKVESTYYYLPYQEGGETTGATAHFDDVQSVLYSTSSLSKAQSHVPKLTMLDLFNTGNFNRTDDLDIILSDDFSHSKHEPREKFDIDITDKIMQSTEALSTHSIDYVTPKLKNSKRRTLKMRKPRLLELKNILFPRSKNKREILKHAKVLQNTNSANTSKGATVIAKLNNDNDNHNSTYIMMKLTNGIITKLNNIFNNTNKIYLTFRDLKPEIMYGRDKVINTHSKLNASSFKEICTITHQRKGNYNDLAKIPSSKYFSEGIKHSNGFVPKMPLKILKSLVTVDGFKSKLANEHNSNVIKQLNWLRNFTTTMIVPKCSAPSAKMNNSEKKFLTSLSKHIISVERVLRDCYSNMSRNFEETPTINLDVKGSGVTIQSLYNVINIYCGDCNYKHINGSNKVNSVFNDSNVNHQIIEENTMDEYATPENAPQDFFESHESNRKEYVENTTEALRSSTNNPSFVEITLIPLASKRRRNRSKLLRKYKKLFGNIHNKHVLNNTNTIK